MDQPRPLLLGSASPRRREILATLRIPTVAVPAHADETQHQGELPDDYLKRVTLSKLASVAPSAALHSVMGVLVADTIVLVDDELLGKPRDKAHAVEMLLRLSGRPHEVWTRFVLAAASAPATAVHQETVRTRVEFRALSPAEIQGYADTGEGLDKAGAYAVQGVGSFAVERIEGSYLNVVGLPACEVVAALLSSGLIPRYPL